MISVLHKVRPSHPGANLIRLSTTESRSDILTTIHIILTTSRSPSPNRSMLTLPPQFPWFATNLYTIHTRDELCSATYLMLQALVHQLQSGGFPHQLNDALLQDLLYAGLNAPGFSESQKWKLAIAAGYAGNEVRMSQQCENWPYHTIGRKANWDEDVIRVSVSYPNFCVFLLGSDSGEC